MHLFIIRIHAYVHVPQRSERLPNPDQISKICLDTSSQGVEHIIHPRFLHRCKVRQTIQIVVLVNIPGHARVLPERYLPVMRGVVHIVMNRVDARQAGARILRWVRGAPLGGFTLRGCVVNQVPFAGAVEPLESVEEPEPVPDFVRRRLALIVHLVDPAGQGRRVDVAAVPDVVRGPVDTVVEGVLVRELAPPLQRVAYHAAVEVDVQLVVLAPPESLRLLSVQHRVRPLVVHRERGVLMRELDPVGGERLIEDIHLHCIPAS